MPLIYVDESGFNSWMHKHKSWSLPDKLNNHLVNSARHSVSVFGAIGNCLRKPVYHLDKGVGYEQYIRFLKKVIKELRPGERPILLYDGAPGHRKLESQALMNEHFYPLPNVPYSCAFNCKWQLPFTGSYQTSTCLSKAIRFSLHARTHALTTIFSAIEHVWSVAKSNFKRHMLLRKMQQTDLTLKQFRDMVKLSVEEIADSSIRNIISSNKSYIKAFLRQADAAPQR